MTSSIITCMLRLVGGIKELLEVVEGAVGGIDVDVVGDVVAVIASGARE